MKQPNLLLTKLSSALIRQIQSRETITEEQFLIKSVRVFQRA